MIKGVKVITLCGSTRFVDAFNEWRKKLTLDGIIILSIELVLLQSEREDPQHNNYKVKQMLDELHLRKIDLSDEIFVLNVGGYIGESTSREIAYAQKTGKEIKYLEPVGGELSVGVIEIDEDGNICGREKPNIIRDPNGIY